MYNRILTPIAIYYPNISKSYLKKSDTGIYVCEKCGKEFTTEQAEKIELLLKLLDSPRTTQNEINELVTDDILPCKYYLSATEKVICKTARIILGVKNKFFNAII